ncbi:MAG: prolipoprotein diacylglyceryl transferase family protein, partial [Porphyromonas pasteri]
YIGNPLSIFYIWEGGLAIHGGIIGAFIGSYPTPLQVCIAPPHKSMRTSKAKSHPSHEKADSFTRLPLTTRPFSTLL